MMSLNLHNRNTPYHCNRNNNNLAQNLNSKKNFG